MQLILKCPSYKRVVFDAAVTSSLLYSTESWLSNNVKRIEKQYNQLVRCLLGVRKNTSINMCMLEAGIVPVRDLIAKQRCKFMKRKLETVNIEQPFHIVYNICSENNTPGFRFVRKSISYDCSADPLIEIANLVRTWSTDTTKMSTYDT